MGLTLLCGLFGFLLFLALHILIWRARPSSSPRIFLLGALMAAGCAASLVLYAFQRGAGLAPMMTLVLFHAFMAMVYINLYGSLVRSVSITLLLEILKADPVPVPFDRLLKDYLSSSRFDDRVMVMKNMGWVDIDQGEVRLTAKGSQVATMVHGLSTVLSGRLEG